MSETAELVLRALDALKRRDWESFEATLHEEVVHRTPGVPAPILGRAAFVQMSREAVSRAPDVVFALDRLVADRETVVAIGEWRYTGPEGLVRQPSVSVIQFRDGLIWRDEEYLGLAF